MLMSERARLAALVVIWGVFGMLAMTTIIVQGTEANFIILGIMAFAAWLATDSVMNSGKKEEKEEEVSTKAKRSGTDPLLALLDEDDLAELRARVKRRLINSIDGGTDGELSSLDHLLAEQESQQQRR